MTDFHRACHLIVAFVHPRATHGQLSRMIATAGVSSYQAPSISFRPAPYSGKPGTATSYTTSVAVNLRGSKPPEFEGIDDWIPRPYREALSEAIGDRVIQIERIVLPDGPVNKRRCCEAPCPTLEASMPAVPGSRGSHGVTESSEGSWPR